MKSAIGLTSYFVLSVNVITHFPANVLERFFGLMYVCVWAVAACCRSCFVYVVAACCHHLLLSRRMLE